MVTKQTITAPAMLGMLGGGQLGRFFVIAAHELGYQVTVLDPIKIVLPAKLPMCICVLTTTMKLHSNKWPQLAKQSPLSLKMYLLIRLEKLALTTTVHPSALAWRLHNIAC